jgi:Immunity protein 50
MALPVGLESITGAQELYDWFGYWPDFHDAEIIKFRFDLSGPSCLAVHTWEMTNQLDSKGHYDQIKHVVVEFTLERVSALSLDQPLDQSILFELGIDKTETGFRMSFSATYGLSGTIDTKALSLCITPGKPFQNV